MLKTVKALVLSALLLVFVAGCGNNDQAPAPAQPGQEEGMPGADQPAMAPEPDAPAQPK